MRKNQKSFSLKKRKKIHNLSNEGGSGIFTGLKFSMAKTRRISSRGK